MESELPSQRKSLAQLTPQTLSGKDAWTGLKQHCIFQTAAVTNMGVTDVLENAQHYGSYLICADRKPGLSFSPWKFLPSVPVIAPPSPFSQSPLPSPLDQNTGFLPESQRPPQLLLISINASHLATLFLKGLKEKKKEKDPMQGLEERKASSLSCP